MFAVYMLLRYFREMARRDVFFLIIYFANMVVMYLHLFLLNNNKLGSEGREDVNK